MEKKTRSIFFKKKDLEIGLDDGTRYILSPGKDVCLYKVPYRPDREGEEFYLHKTKNYGRQFYRLHFGENWAKFQGVDEDYIAATLKDEEIKHGTVIRRDQLDLLERYGIKLASI